MSKFSKIFKIGAGIAKPFVPGIAGSALDVVSNSIADHGDPKNEGALKALAADNDEQTAAILALHERVEALENRK